MMSARGGGGGGEGAGVSLVLMVVKLPLDDMWEHVAFGELRDRG